MNYSDEIKWDGERIALRFQSPDEPRKLVLMAHGGPGGSMDGPGNLFSIIEERLTALNYATCRFDFRGAGNSSGSFGDVTLCSLKADLVRVKSWCAAKLDVPILLLGESLGATIALMATTDYKAPMVLLWPAIELRTTSFNGFMTDDALETLSSTGHLMEDGLKISHQFIDECMTLDLWPKLAHFKGRYFIAHGEQDRDVPVSQSDRLSKELGSRCAYLKISGAGHGAKDPESQEMVLTCVAEWIVTL